MSEERPPPIEQDPAIYLREQTSPTAPCHRLVKQIDSHDGDHVPMHMLAKVAVRLHALADWAARWDGRERLARRIAALVIGASVANGVVIVKSWISAHDARIEATTEARAAEKAEIEYRRSVKDQMDRMEQDIRELRHTCGLDPKPITIVQTRP